MRTDRHDPSHLAVRTRLPAIDHEANGPVSAIVQLSAWLGRLWSERAEKARGQLILESRRWL